MQPFHPSTPLHQTFSATPDSPRYEKESHIGSEQAATQARIAADGVVRDYEEKRDRLSKAIESSKYLVADLRNFNNDQWTVRYPSLRPVDDVDGSTPTRPGMSRRTLTFADEPSSETDVVLNSTPTVRRTFKRSLTLAPAQSPSLTASTSLPSTIANAVADLPPKAAEAEDDFSILRLDLNMGAARHAKALISHLEKSSISSLLDTRLASSLDHLVHLQTRIHDAQSRVLVTGDLNAGKSTLINALLRRNEVMPTDQQPLTTRFVEVVSAKENEDREEIHVLQGEKYDIDDKSTYTVEKLERLEELVIDADASSYPLRVFLKEAAADLANPSILHNGVVDISLIDAPGLNRDSIKTTANFARQEEIDVVVFVVSAANHFTLSAKEFIWQAGQEKAHLFIVVNRFDQIRDKERCRRIVLEQIKQLSPKTYEDAADLVHFVDSAKVAFGFSDDDTAEDLDDAFAHLEHSLRSFVLVNRAKSKLGPAQNYVTHLLADVELLAQANSLVATKERELARDELNRVKPVLEKMKKGREGLEEGLVTEEEKVIEQASSRTKQCMMTALDRVGRGELAAVAPGIELPSYPGLIGVWDYAREVKQALLRSLDFAISLAESDTRKLTTEGVARVGELGDKHLPVDVERSKRVFNPNAMFSRGPSRRVSGVSSVGLGLASQPHLGDVTVSDIFDFNHHIFLARSSFSSTSQPSPSRDLISSSLPTELSGLGIASLAVGALSLGGKTIGIHQMINSVVKLSDLASNQNFQKWVGPVIGVFAIGTIGYIIYDLPQSIPRNVGRHIQATLVITSGEALSSDAGQLGWTEYTTSRITKETRKVMRLAAWDLKERFRVALDARGEVVRESEEVERKAQRAIKMFEEVGKKVEVIREEIGGVKV